MSRAFFSRVRSRLSAVPRVVWCVVAVHFVLLSGYSILLPAYRAPDEPFHFDVAQLMAQGHGYPDYDERHVDPAIVRSLKYVEYYTKSAHLRREKALPRDQRPSLDQLHRLGESGAPLSNQIVQHPPLYYELVGNEFRAIDWILPGDPFRSFDREVGFMRFLSSLFIAPLPLFIWAICQRLRLGRTIGVAASMLPLTIPQLQHLGATVNNDTLFILVTAALTLVVVRIALGDTRTKVVLGAGALTGLAMFTKAFAFVYPVWIVAALVVGWRSQRKRFDWVQLASLAATSFAFGGWWWFRNLVKFGEISPSVEFANRLDKVPKGFHPDWGYWLDEAWRRMTTTFFGNFGWYDTAIPGRILPFAFAALGFVVAFALAAPRRQHDTPPLPSRLVTLLLLAPFVLVGTFVLLNAARLYAHSSQPVLLQSRYLFGGLVGIAVVSGIAMRAVQVRAAAVVRWAPIAVFVAAIVMHAFAFRTILRFYWGAPTDGLAGQLRAVIAWSPWPGKFVALAAAIGSAAVVALAALLVAEARQPLAAQVADEVS